MQSTENLIEPSKKRLKVGFITSHPSLKTGFARNAKLVLSELYERDVCDIFLLAQGLSDNNPEFARWPWKTTGAIPSNVDQARWKADEAYQRWVAYGNQTVERFVTENKLDVVFHIEDIWSSDSGVYLGADWFNKIKQNFVQWSTADSLPILEQYKIWADECPNVWMWSNFAENALKQEDAERFSHVKTLGGASDSDKFKPISKSEKNELRDRFGIARDDLIFLYLGRNQSRKLFWANIEALAKAKKTIANKNIKLLFHTNWSEGWNIKGLIDELKLDQKDILATYFCKSCGHIEIKPYAGDGIACKACGAKDKLFTPGIDSTITEDELAQIVYGISDASSSVFNSGGLEYFNVESLLCGLPLATTPYSCGEDFAAQPFVHSIEGSYTREIGTNFKKYVPNSNSIVKFFKAVSEASENKLNNIKNAGRAWATNKFSKSSVTNKVQEFIESCDAIDWEGWVPRGKARKNASYEIPNIADNFEFIKDLYNNILLMNPSRKDSGVENWLNQLENGTSRQDIHRFFIGEAMKDNALLDEIRIEDIFESENGRKKLMLVAKESIGDVFIVTSLLDDIKNKYPEHDVYFVTDEKNFELVEGNENIYKIVQYSPMLDNEMLVCGFGGRPKLVDVYINPFILIQKYLGYLSQN